MIRNRSTRVLATLGVSISLALTALAGPVTVLAAQAEADFTATPVLSTVSPSIAGGQASYIGYVLSFALAEGETSNLPQLFLRATTPDGWDLWTVDNPSRPGCDATGDHLFCSFGALDADDGAITLTVVYKVGTSTGDVTVPFEFNTTGVANDKPGKSHGDAYTPEVAPLVTVENNANFGASYPQAVGDVISDATNLGRNNPQYTKVHSPGEDIVVTVGENNGLTECQALFGSACFGQASEIHVGSGAVFTQFLVELGVNANKPNSQWVHFFDPGVTVNGLAYEELGSCSAIPVAPCASVMTSGGKTFVSVYITRNGKIFGH